MKTLHDQASANKFLQAEGAVPGATVPVRYAVKDRTLVIENLISQLNFTDRNSEPARVL